MITKKFNISLFFIATILFTVQISFSQIKLSNVNFRSPMDISLIVAGNFGEVRSNHFHTGMDFKTQGVEGKKIYAIEDGYVSRIGYSHYGYGKVLYITHRNGYTSVYAHLSSFNKNINECVRDYQYSLKKETFDMYLDSNRLVVKKGEIVALSGNSGSSFAPHLHFEIRQTVSEQPMNPLLFGYKITDNNKPMIYNLKVYPLDNYSLVNGKQKSAIIPVRKNKAGDYYINESITGYGNVGCALHSTDRMNARNVCGLYSLELSVNDEHLFGHKMDKLDFSTSRYVNHHVDYPGHKQYNNSFHKSFLMGNNLLDIYKQVNEGFTNIEHDTTYKFKYVAKDYSGNSSSLDYIIKGDSSGYDKATSIEAPCNYYFTYNSSNLMEQSEFTAMMTPSTLYEDLCVAYKSEKSSSYLSDIHTFGTRYAGIQQAYKLIITPNVKIDSALHDKLLIVSINDKGSISDKGGEYQQGTVTTRVKEFGSFAISIDTTKPFVRLGDNQNVYALRQNSSIQFKISDDLSGIKSYSASLNGDWILTEYDRKKGVWNVSLSEKKNLSRGTHKLVIEVIDQKENKNKSEVLIFIL
jgi:hypothetical protein